MSETEVIDITKYLKRNHMMGELVEGIPLDLPQAELMEFQYQMMRFLTVQKNVTSKCSGDKISLFDDQNFPLFNLSFEEGRLSFLLPDCYIGTNLDLEDLGEVYILISKFCEVWKSQ